ncbi:MAG: aminopeptidase P family protein [Tannerella sp.]|jgi:Xaa-Pro aminopeptidase|nr:aminopeptidase P family protein [Tannerella sp.]
MSEINKRIALLREYMAEKNLQAFIIPSTDAHMSEYIPEHWESRKWISGFTGSAGTAVVTSSKAGLWTDSRYFLQAEAELAGSDFLLFKDRIPGTISIIDWLKNELAAGDRIGIDGNVYSAKEALRLQSALEPEKIYLLSGDDPFEKIRTDRPALPKNAISSYPVELAGEPAARKIERLLSEAAKAEADSVWISTLDTIAWLFNIRGTDVPYNPVVIAHAFLSQNENILFVDTDKITPTVAEDLHREGIKVMDYNLMDDFLARTCNLSIHLDTNRLSFRIYKALSERNWIVDQLSVADQLKSIKNETEVEGFRRSMVRDGIALTKFFRWLEKALPEGHVTEHSAGVKLKEFRSEQSGFAGESFPTIAGYGPNAAIVHYHPDAADSLPLRPEGLLLVDSGGQYTDGTTDLTRTVALGALTHDMKRDYTLTLKGMIGLSKAVFPAGTRGSQIDILARKAIWEQGINYLHGTGHGVGHYLNVHEGPQSIRPEENPIAICPGMILTNEPGIYRDHAYGVRIENMMLTTHKMTTSYGDFFRFETLTLCYIDTHPIIKTMMTNEEIEWLNDYHRIVYEKLSPHLSDDENKWLIHKTQPLT